MRVCWLSAGVSSFIAGYLMRKQIDHFIYIRLADQHPDSERFIKDCSEFLNRPIEILQTDGPKTVDAVCRKHGFLRSGRGTLCSRYLKTEVGKQWAKHQKESLIYVWGLDCTEKSRVQQFMRRNDKAFYEFPLVAAKMTKDDAHRKLAELGIKRPLMYDLGYQNNNCIGCLRGGMAYWNDIRRDFPKVFASRAKLERDLGHSILTKDGRPLFLDELPADAGHDTKAVRDV